MPRIIASILLLTTLIPGTALAQSQQSKTPEINQEHLNEVCTVILRKLKASFKALRTGNITDTKTGKVADLIQSYRLLKCPDEKSLIDVMACTNTQFIFTDECRNLPID